MTIKMAGDYTTPRMVSLKEMRDKLVPLIGGWKWADDAINDLWLKGAPDPQNCVCPRRPHCKIRECPHVKRVLLPGQFAKWWKEVAERQGFELEAIKTKAVKDGQRY